MIARPFSQPSVVHALCLTLARLHDGATVISASILADAVAAKFPEVPTPALRVIAAKVLGLHFDPETVLDMGKAGLDRAEEATACEFFAAALAAEADSLAQYRDRRDGANVVRLPATGV